MPRTILERLKQKHRLSTFSWGSIKSSSVKASADLNFFSSLARIGLQRRRQELDCHLVGHSVFHNQEIRPHLFSMSSNREESEAFLPVLPSD